MSGLKALVLGATGEVGKELIKHLDANAAFSHIVLITRRPVDLQSEKITTKLVDFEKLDEYKEAFDGVQVAYCCLGTTRGKAGAEGFVRVDRDYVTQAAQLLRQAGCAHFHLVTSTGANKTSMFLYNKTKGEAEAAVTELSFPHLTIYQPSLLLCDRQESRPMEKVAQVVIGTLDWGKKISIKTETVARAMINNTITTSASAKSEEAKVEILGNGDILRLGRK